MEIVKDKVLLFRCGSDTAERIKQFIDKSEVVDETEDSADMVVYWGIDEVQRLARVLPQGVKIPSPI